MKVIRTERIWLAPSETLDKMSHIAKNLYNEANYIVRQDFTKNRKWIRYNTLDKLLKQSENYRALPSGTTQQTLMILDCNWQAFFKAMKEWKAHPEKFHGRPKLPKYKAKNGNFTLIFTNQQVKLECGILRFPKKIGLEVKTRLGDDTNIREARIVPKGTGYWLEIVYEKEVEPQKLNGDNIAGIDVGTRNIVTMVDNTGNQPIVVKGGVLRSINQYYNKEKAWLQAIYDRQELEHTPKRLMKLSEKRNNKIRDYMHKLSKWIVEYCKSNDIGILVVGYNENWKQGVEMGKKNNQTFVQIPYTILIDQLQYKCEEAGISMILQEESHTSLCSFLDGEPIDHHEQYMGKRISRGLYRSARGIIINADVNGAYNIVRKAIPKAFAKVDADGIEGVGLHPARLREQFLFSSCRGF
jgi:IS605 OrfB family transposase